MPRIYNVTDSAKELGLGRRTLTRLKKNGHAIWSPSVRTHFPEFIGYYDRHLDLIASVMGGVISENEALTKLDLYRAGLPFGNNIEIPVRKRPGAKVK